MTYQRVNRHDGQIPKKFEVLSDNLLKRTLETAATSSENGRYTTVASRAAGRKNRFK